MGRRVMKKMVHVKCVYSVPIQKNSICEDSFLFSNTDLRCNLHGTLYECLCYDESNDKELVLKWLLWCGSIYGFKYLTISILDKLTHYVVSWSRILRKILNTGELIKYSYYGYKIISNKPINIWWFTASSILENINKTCIEVAGSKCFSEESLLDLVKIIHKRNDNEYGYKFLYSLRKSNKSIEDVALALRLLLYGRIVYTMENPDVYIKIIWIK